jgi:hypothetical protein
VVLHRSFTVFTFLAASWRSCTSGEIEPTAKGYRLMIDPLVAAFAQA